MSRSNRVRSTPAAVHAALAAMSGGLTIWFGLYLIARYLIAQYEEQLPGDPGQRPPPSEQMVCTDCDKQVSPKQSPSGQLNCPYCGGQNLRER